MRIHNSQDSGVGEHFELEGLIAWLIGSVVDPADVDELQHGGLKKWVHAQLETGRISPELAALAEEGLIVENPSRFLHEKGEHHLLSRYIQKEPCWEMPPEDAMRMFFTCVIGVALERKPEFHTAIGEPCEVCGFEVCGLRW